VQEQNQEVLLPADWIERYFWVPRPRNPKTGEMLPAGPIQLTDHQKHLINEALSRNPDGTFKYALVVYSAPKKSGKSAVAAAVATYVAHHSPYGFIACVANDGKQANDRIYAPIKQNYRLHRQQQGPFKDINPYEYEVTIPNFCKIEAVPVDAAGEAGGEPTLSVFCFDEETEVLTNAGWKRYTDLDSDSVYATTNPTNGAFEWQKADQLNIFPYDGKMYLYENQLASVCVTPNHRFLGKIVTNTSRSEKQTFTVEEAFSTPGMRSIEIQLNSWGEFKGALPEFVKDGKFSFAARTHKKAHREPFVIDLFDFMELLGWYLSEGCVKYKTRKGKTSPECVMIGVSKDKYPDNYARIWNLLEKIGVSPKHWKSNDSICFYDMRLTAYFTQFGLAQDKFVPRWVKELPAEYLERFLVTYYQGDGYLVSRKKDYGFAIGTISSWMMDDLSEIGLKLGYAVSAQEYEEARSSYTAKVVRFSSKGKEKYKSLPKKSWKQIDYKGYVWCPSTKNGLIYVRRNRSHIYCSHNSELWGFDTPKKRQLWTELTVPPTLYGYAMQWVESYAGYTGVSVLLESLYTTGKKEGTPHPDFSYLDTAEGPVVYTHAPSRMFMYWDTEPRMPWQIGTNYYEEQRNTLEPEEFERIHRNRWVSAKGAFIEAQWWDNCESPSLPVLKQGDKTPVVVAIDMSVSNDLAAMVAVTRDPINPDTDVAVRAVKIFNPKKLGGNIDQEQTVGNTIREWASRWNVICWVYDPYQMAKLVQDYRKDGFGWFDPFTQNTARGIADKQLYDMVMHRQLTWNRTTTIGDVGSPGIEEDTLYQHIRQAGAVISGRQRRLEKLSPEAKIDAAVALSMAAYKCMELELDNREFEKEDLLQMLAKGEIELEAFSQIVRQKFPELGEKYIDGSR